MAASKAFFESANMVTRVTPDRVITDAHDSCPRAIRTDSGAGVQHRNSRISTTGWSKIIAVLKAAKVRCVRSGGRDPLAGSAGPTTSSVTFSVPAHAPSASFRRLPQISFPSPHRNGFSGLMVPGDPADQQKI
jgi:hypothetical protein